MSFLSLEMVQPVYMLQRLLSKTEYTCDIYFAVVFYLYQLPQLIRGLKQTKTHGERTIWSWSQLPLSLHVHKMNVIKLIS